MINKCINCVKVMFCMYQNETRIDCDEFLYKRQDIIKKE